MAIKENLTEARRLLELYYEGTTTPDEMAELRRLLAESEPLPEDLAAERRLLDLLEEARDESESSIDVPEGLEAALRLNVRRMAAAEGRSRMLRRSWVRRCGVAAAVLIGVGVAYHYYDGQTTIRENHLTAHTEGMKETPQQQEEPMTMIAEAVSPVTEEALSKTQRQGAVSQNKIHADKAVSGESAPDDRHLMRPTVQEPQKMPTSAFTLSEREALAMAVSEMQQVSEDVFLSIRDDMDIASVETVSTFSDVQTTFMDDIYPSGYSDSETIMEP